MLCREGITRTCDASLVQFLSGLTTDPLGSVMPFGDFSLPGVYQLMGLKSLLNSANPPMG